MDSTGRLRIATRIHFALLRHYGENVDARTLLRGEDAAREALWVCEASGHAELVALGQKFSAMLAAEADARAQRQCRVADVEAEIEPDAPQDAIWALDTSGFGATRSDRQAAAGEPESATVKPWFKPGRGRTT